MTRLVGPWNFCTGLPDRHGGSNPTYDTRACQHHSGLHLQELVFYGLGAANFLPECTHTTWYGTPWSKLPRKKNRNVVFVFARNCPPAEVSNGPRVIRENAVHTALRKIIETLCLCLCKKLSTCRSIKRPPGYTRKCRARRLAIAKKETTLRVSSSFFFCTRRPRRVWHPLPRRPARVGLFFLQGAHMVNF